MNRRLFLTLFITLVSFTLARPARVFGQSNIDQHVSALMDAANSNDKKARTDARDAFLTDFTSAQDRAAYDNAVSTKLIEKLGMTTTNAVARENIAVVAEKLAEQSPKINSPKLIQLVTTLLGDKSEAVVYWGEMAAQFVTFQAFKNHLTDVVTTDLRAAIIASATNFQTGPLADSIAWTASKALNNFDGIEALSDSSIKAVVDASQDLLKARLALYQTGTPASPRSDGFSSLLYFDVSTPIWSRMTQAEQLRAVQETSDLINFMGQRYGDKSNADFIRTLHDIADKLDRFNQSQFQKSAVLDAALNELKLLPPTAGKDVVAKACTDVYKALSGLQSSASTGGTGP